LAAAAEAFYEGRHEKLSVSRLGCQGAAALASVYAFGPLLSRIWRQNQVFLPGIGGIPRNSKPWAVRRVDLGAARRCRERRKNRRAVSPAVLIKRYIRSDLPVGCREPQTSGHIRQPGVRSYLLRRMKPARPSRPAPRTSKPPGSGDSGSAKLPRKSTSSIVPGPKLPYNEPKTVPAIS